MLRTTARRTLPTLTRSYVTGAPSTSPPPYPAVKSSLYDPDQEPALADLGYPKLSTASRQTRQPKGWWDTQERINFGEPVSPSPLLTLGSLSLMRERVLQLPENDDIQSMWAPDVHKVKPFSALSQLLTMFGALAVFSYGVYNIQAPAPAVRSNPLLTRHSSKLDTDLFANVASSILPSRWFSSSTLRYQRSTIRRKHSPFLPYRKLELTRSF